MFYKAWTMVSDLLKGYQYRLGYWDWKDVSSFIRGDESYICGKVCGGKFPIDTLKSPKVTMYSYWAEYSLII